MKIHHCSRPSLSMSFLVISLSTPQKVICFKVEMVMEALHGCLTGCCMTFGIEPVGCISYCQRGWAHRRFLPTFALAWDVIPGKSPAASEQGLSTALGPWVAPPSCPSVPHHLPPSLTSAATATTVVKRHLQDTCWWTRHPCSTAVYQVSFPWWTGKMGHEAAVLTWWDCIAHSALLQRWFQAPPHQTLSEVSVRNNIIHHFPCTIVGPCC